MTRLIDADALLQEIDGITKDLYGWQVRNIKNLITNAPTVQREGWVSVPVEPTDDMCRKAREITGISANAAHHVFLAMMLAAPTDME